jgi:hypothetical protein
MGGLWGRFPCKEVPQQLDRVCAQHPGNGHEFEQINPALAILIFSNERLWAPELLGKNLLGHISGGWRAWQDMLVPLGPASARRRASFAVSAFELSLHPTMKLHSILNIIQLSPVSLGENLARVELLRLLIMRAALHRRQGEAQDLRIW